MNGHMVMYYVLAYTNGDIMTDLYNEVMYFGSIQDAREYAIEEDLGQCLIFAVVDAGVVIEDPE